MSDDTPIHFRMLFGRIEHWPLPHRVDGNDLVYRSRIVHYDGDGNIEKDYVFEGCRLINGAAPDSRSWWEKFLDALS